jgi:hypothetical protein
LVVIKDPKVSDLLRQNLSAGLRVVLSDPHKDDEACPNLAYDLFFHPDIRPLDSLNHRSHRRESPPRLWCRAP